MHLRFPGRPGWLLPALGLMILVGVICFPFGLRRPDRMEGWVLMNDLERQDSPISPNLDGTGRPLLLLSWFVAHKLDPNSFVGAHVLLMVLIFGKGVTQYALLKRLLPERGLLAFLAAVLFVVYPADTGTADTRILNIHSAVLFFLLGVYLLVVCWQARNRWAAVGLGLAAAIAVTASLATYEAAYPLVIAAPLILLWLARQDVRRVIRRLALTMGLWYAGPAVYGIYWLRTTVGALPPYQNQLLLGGLRVENAASQMGAALLHAYWQGFWGGWVGAVSLTGSTYTGLAVLAALTIACCAWHVRHVVMPGAQSLGIAGAGLFVFFLGFLPYLPTSLRTDTWRVYLYASIGATCGVAALFSAHKAIGIGLISPLVVLGILSNLHEQQLFTDNSLAQERILEAIVKQAPQIHPGTLLLLLDDPADMSASRTFWANFYFENAVRFLYADDTLHARICYPNLGTWGEWHDRCQLGDGQVRIEGGGSKSAIIQPYETVLAFRYSPTAGADLLAQFPSVYRPGQASASYDPRKVMAASGTPPRRASTLFDSWSIPASQAEDTPIVDGETIGLGSSWYPPESDASGTFQWIDNDAEFIIGARAEPTAILSLELEPGPGLAYQPFTFRVLNSDGQRVAVGRVHTHQTVQLILPLEPDRATLFRLHVDAGGQKIPSDSRILNFRVFKMSVLSAVASDQR